MTVLAVNILGDGLRDTLDPRLEKLVTPADIGAETSSSRSKP